MIAIFAPQLQRVRILLIMISTRLSRRSRRRSRKTVNRVKSFKRLQRKKVNYIAGALFSMCFTSAQSSENSHVPEYKIISEWDCLKEKDGITLCEQWIELDKDIKVRVRKGIMVVDCSSDAAVAYVSKSSTITNWMSAVSKVEPIATKPELVHIVLGLPWPFDNRDIVGKYDIDTVDTKHIIVSIYSVDGVAEYPEIVRIKKYCASWEVETVDETATKITFKTFSDERPMFPLWMQDPVVKKIYYNNLHSLKEHLSALKIK